MNQDKRSLPQVTITKQHQSPQMLIAKRLWIPLLLQTGLILAIPFQSVYTQITGKTIILQTMPVDPYDFLRGYSQTLSYDISRVEHLRQLPGWQEGKQGTKFYLILAAPVASESGTPRAWKPVKVSSDRPTNLATNQVAIRGKFTGSRIEYGLETYYMPEAQQQQINSEISQVQRSRQPLLLEAKVDDQGHAVPISFWVSDRNYRF